MATSYLSLCSIFLLFSLLSISHSQLPNTKGYTCTTLSSYPCESYVYYRANSSDLASVADLFSLTHSIIPFSSSFITPQQPFFVPITCSCNTVNINTNAELSINDHINANAKSTGVNVKNVTNMSYASINYTIQKGDTFYLVSTFKFQNLTTYQSVQAVNPRLVPTELEIGVNVVFPIFCKCPSRNQTNTSFLISYVFQPSDTFASIAKQFGSDENLMVEVNGNSIRPYETAFVPVSKLPQLKQQDPPPVPRRRSADKRLVAGLGTGLGICSALLILGCVLFGYREKERKKGKRKCKDEEKMGKGFVKNMNMNLVADVSECLDKYKVYEIEELRKGTEGFDKMCLIQGCVYRGYIGDEFYAIKKMKWNACEELKILQKVNHGSLVKLEGFCIDPEDASCYLVYEYVENGSLYSWLHSNKKEMLNWKTRLRIAIDVANGLQYVHEHTRPRVVHKDIRSSNILLDSNTRGKIANFGLARSGCNAITTHIVGTEGYISPEYINDGIVSTKMDVFSFGVVLLELISGKEVIDGEGRALWMNIDRILEGGEERRERRVRSWMDEVLLRDNCSMESVMNVLAVAIACLKRDPLKRPSMVDVVYALCKSDELFLDISDEGVSPFEVLAR